MDIINNIEKAIDIIDGFTDQSLVRELSDLKQKVVERKLYVVVVGLFKRGKSTLINAMLDDAILPSAVTPVTALITIVEYGHEASATVWFENNTSANIPLQKVEEFVTEDCNPENNKHVKYVHILHPAALLQSVSLVDSPGLGSAYEHNTTATLSFIPRIDAALFLLSADIPISKIDLELLEELKAHVPKIIFVFNKADLLKQSDLDKIVKHNKTILARQLNCPESEISFHIVSGMHPEDENFATLKNNLQSIGENEKEGLLQASSRHQLEIISRKSLLQLQFEADAYLLPITELEERSRQITTSVDLMEEQKDEFQSIIAGKIKMLQQTINENVNLERSKLDEKIMPMIDGIRHTDEKSLKQLQNDINDLILSSFNNTKNFWEAKAKENFTSLLEQYSRRSQSFLHELNTNLSSFLGQSIDLLSQQFDLNAYSSFYLTLDSGLPPVNVSPSFFDRFFPEGLQRKKIRYKWKRHYTEVLTRNTASIMYDLNYKIQESFRKFSYDLSGLFNSVLENMKDKIQAVIADKKNRSFENKYKLDLLRQKIEQLKNLSN